MNSGEDSRTGFRFPALLRAGGKRGSPSMRITSEFERICSFLRPVTLAVDRGSFPDTCLAFAGFGLDIGDRMTESTFTRLRSLGS